MKNNNTKIWIAAIVVLFCLVALLPLFMSARDLSDAIDSATCMHEETDKQIKIYESNYHVYDEFCKDCGEALKSNVEEAHKWNDEGVCTVCKYKCKHPVTSTSLKSYSTTHHNSVERCSVCGHEDITAVEHAFNYQSFRFVDTATHMQVLKCACGMTKNGEYHEHSLRDEYILGTATETGHTVKNWCPYCEYTVSTGVVEHSFENGACTVCDYDSCDHVIEITYENPTDSAGNHTVKKICTLCDRVIEEYKDYHSMVDNKCIYCGYDRAGE